MPEIVSAAVGADTGWATLTVPAGRSYLGSIVPAVCESWGSNVKSFVVPLVSLDHVAAERGLAPDLVKIDVEGGELEVLQGAQRLLARARPDVIFESWPSALERRRLFGFFAALGYTVHDVAVDQRSAALGLERFLGRPGNNFVARPSGAPTDPVSNRPMPTLRASRSAKSGRARTSAIIRGLLSSAAKSWKPSR